MKKLFGVLATVMLFGLTACNNSNQDNSKRTDNPSAELKTLFKLDLVDSGSIINEYDSTASEYYTIKTATNKKESLFVYTTSLDEKISSISTQIDYLTISLLRFESTISSDELTGVKNNFYKEEIMKAESFGIASLNASAPQYNLDISSEVVDNIRNGQTGYKLTTVYIPTLVTRVKSESTLLEVYMMLPLYSEVYKDTSASFTGLNDITAKISFENSYVVIA